MNTVWVLVLLLKWGNAGGVAQIEYPTYESCKVAKAQVERMQSYEDSICIERKKL